MQAFVAQLIGDMICGGGLQFRQTLTLTSRPMLAPGPASGSPIATSASVSACSQAPECGAQGRNTIGAAPGGMRCAQFESSPAAIGGKVIAGHSRPQATLCNPL